MEVTTNRIQMTLGLGGLNFKRIEVSWLLGKTHLFFQWMLGEAPFIFQWMLQVPGSTITTLCTSKQKKSDQFH